MDIIRTDCLVIGSGLAGSAYALHAARAGLDVCLVSKGGPYAANSDWAQGGIIYDREGAAGSLAEDIMEASDNSANPAAIEQLVREGPAAVEELRPRGGRAPGVHARRWPQRAADHSRTRPDRARHSRLGGRADCGGAADQPPGRRHRDRPADPVA
jgi:aspartate oxidase